jgi:hypothetical protein
MRIDQAAYHALGLTFALHEKYGIIGINEAEHDIEQRIRVLTDLPRVIR